MDHGDDECEIPPPMHAYFDSIEMVQLYQCVPSVCERTLIYQLEEVAFPSLSPWAQHRQLQQVDSLPRALQAL